MNNPAGQNPEKKELSKVYKQRGYQQVSLNEYLALKREKEKRAQRKAPPAVKILLATPVMILFAFSLAFLTFMLYQIFSSAPAKSKTKKSLSYSSIMRKKSE